jgi:hypothetical protein
MRFRDFIKYNIGLRCFAILLGALTWLAIHFEVGQGFGSGIRFTTQEFTRQKITMLSNSGDARSFVVTPPEAAITLKGDAESLQRFGGKGLRVFVNLTEFGNVKATMVRVEVLVPSGIQVIKVVPDVVRVEVLSSSKSN